MGIGERSARAGLAGAVVLALVAGAAGAETNAPPVLVAELQAQGPGGPGDEFVELVNAGQGTAAIGGWRVEMLDPDCGAARTVLVPAGVTLAAGQHYLVGADGYDGAVAPDLPDAYPGNALHGGGGGARLVDGGGMARDVVGYGTAAAACVTGHPAPAPPDGGSITRLGDTGDDAADFGVRATPAPQNTGTIDAPASEPAPPPAGAAAAPAGAVAASAASSPPATIAVRPREAIERLHFVPRRPRVGEPAFLVVRARDRLTTVDGMQADFGERGRATGLSACRSVGGLRGPFAPGATVTFRVPYTFAESGAHRVRVDVSVGGCFGTPVIERAELRVAVRPAARRARAAAVLSDEGCASRDIVPTAENVLQVRTATRCLLNHIRRTRGLRTLRPSSRLRVPATRHTQDMLTRGFFQHSGPAGPAFGARLAQLPYPARTRRPWLAGENLGWGSGPLATPVEMVHAWMHSPGHRDNILRRSFRYIGIAIQPGAPVAGVQGAATYTTVFGTHRR